MPTSCGRHGRLGKMPRPGPVLASPNRDNNFDLLRLLAAVQVLIVHGVEHLDLAGRSALADPATRFLQHWPGVIVFFAISGLLIPWAYERGSGLALYAKNRALRLYPALWVSFAVTFAVLTSFGFVSAASFTHPPFLAWLLGQITVFQFYTPDVLRPYGLHNPNGALWTIVVEIQFYALVPLVITAARRWPRARRWMLFALYAASLGVNLAIGALDDDAITTKLLRVTVAPYLIFFLPGLVLYTEWDSLRRFVEGRFLPAVLVFVGYSVVASNTLGLYTPSYWPTTVFGVLASLLLAWVTMAAAFTAPTLSHRALRGNDLSYGLYIYHGIVLNVLVQLGMRGSFQHLALLTAASFLCAALSWRLVEKPALALKRRGGST